MAELRMMVGIPGSGKSTLAKHWLETGEVDFIVSSDALREELTGDAGDLSKDDQVWPNFYSRIAVNLGRNRRVVADATHLTPKSWQPLLKLAEEYDVPISAHIMRTPDSVCHERNRQRDRVVPLDAMSRMWWNYIEWVRPKTMSQAGFEIFEHFEEEGGDASGNTDEEA